MGLGNLFGGAKQAVQQVQQQPSPVVNPDASNKDSAGKRIAKNMLIGTSEDGDLSTAYTSKRKLLGNSGAGV